MSSVLLVATFEQAAALAAALGAVHRAGWPVVELRSPYPLQGVVTDVGAGPETRIPLAGLAGGAAGLAVGLAFQAWSSAVSWPMNVGGKPFLAWPAYLPVAFECAILGAVAAVAVAYVGGRASRAVPIGRPTPPVGGAFVLALEARDARQADDAVAVLRDCGARTVETRVPGRLTGRPGTMVAPGRRRLDWRLALTSAAALLLAALLWQDQTRPNYVYAPDMAVSPAATTYSRTAAQGGGVEGTVPRGPLPVRYAATEQDALRAGLELQIPEDLAANPAPLVAADLYTAFCQACHGPEGHGDGLTLKRGFQPPASLLTQQARDMPDGQMFHVISFGQKLMPPHAAQLAAPERWRLVQHVRTLQERLPVDPPPFDPALEPGTVLP